MNTHTPSHGGLPAPSPKSGDAAQPAPLSTPETVARAFADLDRAREDLRICAALHHERLRALKRLAYRNGIGLGAARQQQAMSDPVAAQARCEAARNYRRAVVEFRRVALIAALERIVATDRQLSAGAALVLEHGTSTHAA